MLILSRSTGQTLVIEFEDKMVEVTVWSVRGNQVRIGIDAPKEVIVNREEIHKRIQLEGYKKEIKKSA